MTTLNEIYVALDELRIELADTIARERIVVILNALKYHVGHEHDVFQCAEDDRRQAQLEEESLHADDPPVG